MVRTQQQPPMGGLRCMKHCLLGMLVARFLYEHSTDLDTTTARPAHDGMGTTIYIIFLFFPCLSKSIYDLCRIYTEHADIQKVGILAFMGKVSVQTH
jgi:hypothetical protein